MIACLGSARAARAGDDALVIADLFSLPCEPSRFSTKDYFGEGAETSTRGACAVQSVAATSSYLTR
jgi:hypothetical protein